MKELALSEVLIKLRDDLAAVQREGEGKDVRFVVDDVEIQLQVVVTRQGEGKAGIKFWVINAEAGVNAAASTTQNLRLKLKAVGEKDEPLKISGADRR